jgi:cytochrome c553
MTGALTILGLMALSAASPATAAPPSPADLDFFEKSVRPVLVANCYGCHSNTSGKLRGGLRLDTLNAMLVGGDSGPAIVPGNADASLLIQAIRYQDPDTEMPPKGKLPAEDIKAIERWVAMGAPHPDSVEAPAGSPPASTIDLERGRGFWAYKPPVRTEPPATKDAAWPAGPVDRFILAGLEAAELRPQPDADRSTLARRVSFGLTGLPPSPEELELFLKDRAPDAYERFVDRLLASPDFGERWGRHWLDVARYAESSGKESNILYPHAWRYRDYVIDSFASDKPFDEFLREQIAGDLLPAADDDERAEHLVATGYLAIGPKGHNTRGKQQFRADLVDEQIDAIGQGLLATTIACARCHDHKFDPIPQRDYYAMAGIFMSTDTAYGTYRTQGNDHPSTLIELPAGATVAAGATMPGPIRKAVEQQLKVAEGEAAQFADLQKKAREARKPGSTVKLTAAEQQMLQRARTADGRSEAAADLLARFDENGKPTALNRLAMGAQDAEKAQNARLLSRGELQKPGDTVPRGYLQVLAQPGDRTVAAGSGRRELADWIASDHNPLTARVWVNRVWLHVFGKPIVPTPDNFGASGVRPTDQPLLDWLAVDFMEHGWSTKALVKQLVMSHAYRMSSKADAKALAVDPDDTLLWRMPKRRLEAECIRDAMLMAAGELQMTPPVGSPVNFLEGMDRNPAIVAAARMNEPVRSVYLPVLRDHVEEMLDVFDFAEPAFVSGDRDETSVPTQALFMMNSAAVTEAATTMARRVMAERSKDFERIDRAFALAVGRKPTQAEVTAVKSFFKDFLTAQTGKSAKQARASAKQLEEASWSAFCQALFQSAEFRMVE